MSEQQERSSAKRDALQRRHDEEAPAREQASRERSCFWTWPWGHVYELERHYSTIESVWRCVGCGRRVEAWSHEQPGRLA